MVTVIMFKQCPKCKYKWQSRRDFLDDEGISVIGYQVNFDSTRLGFFLFNHSCGTSLALQVRDFVDLYDGPLYHQRMTGSEDCPGYCLHQNNLDPCPAECECAFVREILQILRRQESSGCHVEASSR